jgi:HEAT repeat protein
MSKDEKLMEELIKEVNNHGFIVKDFNELNSVKRKIKSLVPTLMEYLHSFEENNYKEAIVGLLGVKGFYEATEALLKMYNYGPAIDKWAVGDALYFIEDKRFEDEYIKIASNNSNGISRQMIVVLLGKLRCEKALPTLIELLKDNDVNGHAIMALGYFNNTDLIGYIEPFLKHEKGWIRKEAEKAIKKIKSK